VLPLTFYSHALSPFPACPPQAGEARNLSSIRAAPQNKIASAKKLFHLLRNFAQPSLIDVMHTRRHNAGNPSTANRAGNFFCTPVLPAARQDAIKRIKGEHKNSLYAC
jgi:hypothetical protein